MTCRHVVKTDNARQLLDKICFDADVEPVARRGNFPGAVTRLDLHTEARKYVNDGIRVDSGNIQCFLVSPACKTVQAVEEYRMIWHRLGQQYLVRIPIGPGALIPAATDYPLALWHSSRPFDNARCASRAPMAGHRGYPDVGFRLARWL